MRLIDADKLRKDVLDLPNCYNGFSDTYDKARILDLVDEQPTVDAVPVRHGRWTHKEAYKNAGFGYWFCSECGKPFWWTDMNFCPNCGAKMQGEEDAERND